MQEGTTSSEFVEWLRFLDLDMNEARREDYYLAQLAAVVHRSVLTPQDAGKVRTEDYLIKFQEPQQASALAQQDKAKAVSDSKAFWLTATGLRRG